MSIVASATEKKIYGVERVCKALRMSNFTVHRHLKRASGNLPPRRRRGPHGLMPDMKMTDAIKDSPFYGEGYRKMHARLRYKGIGTSLGAGLTAHARERSACQDLSGTSPWSVLS